jgi:hypothetical protein
MKTIKTLLLVVALTFSSVLVASTNVEDKRTESDVITSEIGKLLKSPSFDVKEEFVTNVTFTVNNYNEMVVLSVNSNNLRVASYIKSRLNYKKIPLDQVNKIIYTVPVRITPGKY